MTLSAGTKLGQYKIVEAIGAGGMGEVYRARDTKLDREVAIKVLPEALSQDKERLARFEREAKLLASLNHPGIATLFGLEEETGKPFLVMELVEGETLAEQIARGPLSVRDALPLFQQIAEALEAAHEKGVIHRDLKPANIKVTPEGKAKVLDFGLAKAFAPQESEVDDSSKSPTLTRGTALGTILGTASYMSPEQARGKPVDKRTDIWAFGSCLYETLTGKKAFEGETVSDTLSLILQREPDWSRFPQRLPSTVTRLLRRCLEKDRRQRLRDIGEARIQLRADPSDIESDVPSRRNVSSLAAALGGGIAIGLLLAWFLWPPLTPPERWTVSILPPEGMAFDFSAGPMALAPDGQSLVFKAEDLLWLRRFDTGVAGPLQGTEGASGPFWSPDSRYLGFAAEGKLKKIDVATGSIKALCDVGHFYGGTWNREGTIVFSTGATMSISRVPDSGGEPVLVLQDDDAVTGWRVAEGLNWPTFLPDGRHFLYLERTIGEDIAEIYLGSLDGEKPRALFQSQSQPLYVPPGWIVFWRDGILRARAFDAGRLELTGESVTVASGVGANPWLGTAHFSVSENGRLAYFTGGAQGQSELVWFDRSGSRLETIGEPAFYHAPRLSHDGRRIAVDISDAQARGDIWLIEVAQPSPVRFTFAPENETAPVWSPDDSQIAFIAATAVFVKPVDGLAKEVPLLPLLKDEPDIRTGGWSPDGRTFVFEVGTYPSLDIWAASLSGGEARAVVASPFNHTDAELSLDGRWLAYMSNESGQSEVYVQAFPETRGIKRRVSTAGGRAPRWSPRGDELFYVDPGGRLMAVDVRLEPELEMDAPQSLFSMRIRAAGTQFDVGLERDRFLVNTLLAEDTGAPMTLIVNWAQTLERP